MRTTHEEELASHPKKGSKDNSEGFSEPSQVPITGRKGTRPDAQLTFLPFLNESRLNISGQEGKLES